MFAASKDGVDRAHNRVALDAADADLDPPGQVIFSDHADAPPASGPDRGSTHGPCSDISGQDR